MLAEKNESMVFNEIAFCSYEKQDAKWKQFHAYDLKQQTKCSDNELIFLIIFIFYNRGMEKENASLCDYNGNSYCNM